MAGYPNLGSISGGMIDAQLDLQNIQLNNFKLAAAPGELLEQQITLKKDQIQLEQQVRLLSLMQNAVPQNEADSPNKIAGVLNHFAMLQAEAGMPDAAAKTAGTASKILEDSSKIDYRAYRMRADRLSKFANILSQVPDSPGGYAQALQTMAAEDPGVASDPTFKKLAQQPWQPGMITKLRDGALTAKEAAEVKYRQQAGDHAAAAAEADKARVPLIREQEKYLETREAAIKKAGGTIVKASQLKTITDMAEVDYPGADPADVRVRSRPLAEEMVKTMREQHLTESEAARQVYEKARSNGIFTGLRTAPVQKGSKPGAPLPLPAAKDAEELKKKLQQNQWYLIEGEPRVLMGDKFYSEDELAAIDKEDEAEDESEDNEEAQ